MLWDLPIYPMLKLNSLAEFTQIHYNRNPKANKQSYSHHLPPQLLKEHELITITGELHKKYGISRSQLADFEIFLRNQDNILDSAQLATEQVGPDGPEKIYVVAPHPLELYDMIVYDSTLNWMKKNIDNPRARMVFWRYHRDNLEPSIVRIARELYFDLDGDARVFDILGSVCTIEPFFLSEFTIWNPDGPRLRVFISRTDKVNNITEALYELSRSHAHWVVQCIEALLINTEKKSIDFPIYGEGLGFERGIVNTNPETISPLGHIQEAKIFLSDDWQKNLRNREGTMASRLDAHPESE